MTWKCLPVVKRREIANIRFPFLAQQVKKLQQQVKTASTSKFFTSFVYAEIFMLLMQFFACCATKRNCKFSMSFPRRTVKNCTNRLKLYHRYTSHSSSIMKFRVVDAVFTCCGTKIKCPVAISFRCTTGKTATF